MKKLTTFINELLKNGNATLIEATDEENVYRKTVCQYLKLGYQECTTYIEKYNKPLIINGKVNPYAKLVSQEQNKEEGEFLQLLCRLVKNNLSSEKSVIQSDSSPSSQTEVGSLERQFILNSAENVLGMSNHSIVCCVSTSIDYLEKYLTEEIIRTTECPLTERKDISSIEAAEDDLMSRIEHITNLAARFKNEKLSKEEYNRISSEWIELYESREFHNCPNAQNNEEKKRDLKPINQ